MGKPAPTQRRHKSGNSLRMLYIGGKSNKHSRTGPTNPAYKPPKAAKYPWASLKLPFLKRTVKRRNIGDNKIDTAARLPQKEPRGSSAKTIVVKSKLVEKRRIVYWVQNNVAPNPNTVHPLGRKKGTTSPAYKRILPLTPPKHTPTHNRQKRNKSHPTAADP